MNNQITEQQAMAIMAIIRAEHQREMEREANRIRIIIAGAIITTIIGGTIAIILTWTA